jgi:hypothetical protein
MMLDALKVWSVLKIWEMMGHKNYGTVGYGGPVRQGT